MIHIASPITLIQNLASTKFNQVQFVHHMPG